MATTVSGVEWTGLREAARALSTLGGGLDEAFKDAMQESGGVVAREAWRLMPVDTGALSRTLKVNRSKSELRISVGNNTTVPYAYTLHAVALGASNGGFTFRVDAHTRRSRRGGRRPVRSYTAARRIPNRPFMFQAWERKQDELFRVFVDRLGALFQEAGRGQ